MTETGDPEFVKIESHDDGVVVIRLDRPPVNALSGALLEELADAASRVAADPLTKAVVVAGSARAFAAGADIAEFEHRSVEETSRLFRSAFDGLAAIPRPVIAAITGYALGGGMEMALACDLRVAADDAQLGQPEILLGIIPGAGGTQRLTRLIGPAHAKDLVWSGRRITAQQAQEIGLVDRVVPSAEVEATALGWASEFAAGAVAAIALAKAAIDEGFGRSLKDALDIEEAAFAKVFDTDDSRIGIASFITNGPGKAKFTGR